MLEVDRIEVRYGAAPALWGVSLAVETAELVCVVGPNGAGKTTLINAIAGVQPVNGGALRFKGRDITRLAMELVLELFPALKEKLRDPAGSLSGGQQQMVAIGRALMARPQLLLLDEPSLGLAPAIVLDMFRAIREINAQGTSVLLVEQNVAMAMELASRAYVMEEGRIVAEGLAAELMSRPEIRRAYLGLEADPFAIADPSA